MINLHWNFRWGYGDDFLSNCCFKKHCVDSTPYPPGANRVKTTHSHDTLRTVLPIMRVIVYFLSKSSHESNSIQFFTFPTLVFALLSQEYLSTPV